MPSKKQKQPVVRKSANPKTLDAKRIRFGGGMAPAVIRTGSAAIRDSGRIRFGGGMISAALKK